MIHLYNSKSSRFSILASFKMTAILLLWSSVSFINAQSPIAVLENADGDTVLSSYSDGALLLPGELGTGNIPVEGPGVRMMWYPTKAAFRAGGVFTDQWDNNSIGVYSAAFGFSTTASGSNSTAFGEETKAIGNYSTAFGFFSEATGFNSTAFGQNTIASGALSTAFGWETEATGESSSAFGSFTEATGNHSTAFGYASKATNSHSTAFGFFSEATGFNSTAFGFSTEATGFNSTAFGDRTIAATENSLSIGQFNNSNRSSFDGTLFVIGNGTFGSRSDAFRVDHSGNVYAGTMLLNSDRRLKENIEHLDPNTLDKLTKISAVRYRFKDQQTKPRGDQIGLIAQEVQIHFPELVTEGNDGYLSVSYNNFTAVLLKGLQEQQIQLEEKNEEIRILKEKIQRLDQIEARLARLENHVPDATMDAE